VVGGFVVGLVVLIGFGSFALATVPLFSGGVMPPERILLAVLLAISVALLSAWLFGRLARRAWRISLVMLPLAIVIGFSLLLASSLPIRAACRTYHTTSVCPPWMR
jgi:hypothetical protein